MQMPNSIADWCSVFGFVWAVLASAAAFWQHHKRQQTSHEVARFLHGLKPAIQGSNQKAVIDQINDQLARLEPPRK